MSRLRRNFDREFGDGAVRIVDETGRPMAEIARELGVNEGTLGNWVRRDRVERSGGLGSDERAELVRLRKENAALRMERDVLKRSVVGWVNDPTR
ncbi:MAG: transposase [Acidimicrobiaceae bacterium]|nr:transposase [Acidimicrobiaceae bacterium]